MRHLLALLLLSLTLAQADHLVKFRPNVGLLSRHAMVWQGGFESGPRIEKLNVWQVVHKNPKALREMSGVEWVERDQECPPAQTQDPMWGNQYYTWPLLTRLPQAWNISTGQGVVVAVCDTGVNPHEDLSLVPGWNVYQNTPDTSDTYGHGTGVAGMAAAVGNNNLGLAGAAHQARIMPVKISDGSASFSNMAKGIIYATDHGAKVANLSFLNTHKSLAVADAAAYAASKGCLVTTGTGNFEPAYRNTDPDNPNMLCVGATTAQDVIATWSVFGPSTDVVAPGENVRTTARLGGYGNASGTSFAAPLVAGIAALIFAKNPTWTPSQVQWVITRGATDKGPVGWDEVYGWGRADAEKALLLTPGGGTEPPPPPVDSQAPYVVITSPIDGQVIKGNGAFSVKVTASDNVGVTRVQIWLNGALQVNLTAEPYTWTGTVRSLRRGSNLVEAKARDAAGNEASHAVVVYR